MELCLKGVEGGPHCLALWHTYVLTLFVFQGNNAVHTIWEHSFLSCFLHIHEGPLCPRSARQTVQCHRLYLTRKLPVHHDGTTDQPCMRNAMPCSCLNSMRVCPQESTFIDGEAHKHSFSKGLQTMQA